MRTNQCQETPTVGVVLNEGAKYRFCNFQPISRRISLAVRERPTVNIKAGMIKN